MTARDTERYYEIVRFLCELGFVVEQTGNVATFWHAADRCSTPKKKKAEQTNGFETYRETMSGDLRYATKRMAQKSHY